MSKKIILIVDDEPTINKVVQDILEPEGYEVISATSAKEALSLLKKTKVDLALLDHFMPGMTGVDLLEEIRKDNNLKNLKCAFITAGVFKELGMKWIKKLGALDYIKKPFQYKDLIKRVKKMIG